MTDREKVIKALQHCKDNQHVFDCHECDYGGKTGTFCIRMIDDTLSMLKEQEAKIEQLNRFVNGFSRDAMPVVRCKDCINCVKEPNGELYCDILAVGYEPLGSKKVADDWFCADGKRKEGR